MKRVDQSIKYLSGELGAEEARAWEEELTQNPALRKDFEDVSFAYELAKSQLLQEDEALFREGLQAAMKAPVRKPKRADGPTARGARHLMMPAAAMVAIAAVLLVFLMVLAPPRNPFERFYEPGNDPYLGALSTATRTADNSLYALYQQQEMEALYEKSLQGLKQAPPSLELALLHLIAALETGRERQALEIIPACNPTSEDPLVRALCWYRALALLKSGNEERAIGALEDLRKATGAYAEPADKLLKVLTK